MHRQLPIKEELRVAPDDATTVELPHYGGKAENGARSVAGDCLKNLFDRYDTRRGVGVNSAGVATLFDAHFYRCVSLTR